MHVSFGVSNEQAVSKNAYFVSCFRLRASFLKRTGNFRDIFGNGKLQRVKEVKLIITI